MRYSFLIIGIIVGCSACNQDNNTTTATKTDAETITTSIDRLPELQMVDSIDMHFFPDINDQKVYTRLGVNDTAMIHVFTRKEINSQFVDQPSCEYDAKFFCFAKGQIVKTLYVAALKDSCRFLGYIKSGGVAVRTALSSSAVKIVSDCRKNSK